jgi:hypothetical protein
LVERTQAHELALIGLMRERVGSHAVGGGSHTGCSHHPLTYMVLESKSRGLEGHIAASPHCVYTRYYEKPLFVKSGRS